MSGLIFKKLTVLVVDDSPHMLKLLSELLRALGVGEIVTASDGEEAWSKFLKHKPDVVFTDAAMAPTDGFALTRRLRSVGEGELGAVPIIMISAHSELSAVERARDVGITDFIRKPVTPRAIYERFVEAINRPREFIETRNFTGPDRRHEAAVDYGGADRRGQIAYL